MNRILVIDNDDCKVHLMIVPDHMVDYCLSIGAKHNCLAIQIQDGCSTTQLDSVTIF